MLVYYVFMQVGWKGSSLRVELLFRMNFTLECLNIFFASSLFKSVTIYGVPRVGRNFDDYPDFQQKARYKILRHILVLSGQDVDWNP